MNQYELAAVSSSIEGIGAGTVKLITSAQWYSKQVKGGLEPATFWFNCSCII